MPSAPPARARRLRDRAGLAAVVAALAILGVVYASLTPPFEGPDSGGHFFYTTWLCDHRQRPPLDAASVAISHELVLQPPLYYILAAPLVCAFDVTPAADLVVPNPHYPGLSHRATLTPPRSPPRAAIPPRLAALVSLIGAILAVVATWGLVRDLLPDAPASATAAAAAVGLNPQFVFSAASITNDAWAAATFAVAVWLAVRARRAGGMRAWLAVGLAVGLAALTKYSNLAAVAPVGLVWLWHVRARGWRVGARAAVAVALGVAATAGYWYAGNLVRYGSPVPFELMQALVPQYVRDQPASIGKVLHEAGWFARSYWGVFGYGVVASGAYFRVVDLLVALGIGGLVAVLPVRAWREGRGRGRSGLGGDGRTDDDRGIDDNRRIDDDRRLGWAALPRGWRFALALAAGWSAVVLGGILNFMIHTRLGNQGRLLFPASPAIAILLVLGWQALAPSRWRPAVLRLVPVVFALLAAWQSVTLARAYAIPPAVAEPVRADHPLDARFDAGPVLVGADLPAGGAAVAGGTLPVTLYLAAREPIATSKLMFVHLSAADDRRLGAFDGVPAGGRHATAQWRPGEVFADAYTLRIADVATDTLAVLSVGFYDPDSGARAVLLDARGGAAGDRAVVGHVMIHRDPPGAGRGSAIDVGPEPVVTWSNGISLDRAEVETGPDGNPTAVAVAWSADRPIHTDLTVFVQLLDRSGGVVAQVDRRPGGGANPTDTWTPGYPVRDAYRFPAVDAVDAPGTAAGPDPRPAAGSAPEWERLIIGFYDTAGRRVPLAGDGAADFAVLRERGISASPTPGL